MRTETGDVDNHQISELTDSIVNDLIKNAFKIDPLEFQKHDQEIKEVKMGEQKMPAQQEYIEIADEEEDNLNLRDSFKE